MPAFDRPMAADGPPVSDEMLHLIYASPDRWAPGSRPHCTNGMTLERCWPRAGRARRVGFGGLGFLHRHGLRALRHRAHGLLAAPGQCGQYRIEPVLQSGPGLPGRHPTETVICDGERRWRIGEDEVTVGLPRRRSGSRTCSTRPGCWDADRWPGGRDRRSPRLPAQGIGRREAAGLMALFPDEIVADAELGILLSWISLAGEQPVARYELRDVVVGPPEPGEFRPDIPPGVRVAEESRDQRRPAGQSVGPGCPAGGQGAVRGAERAGALRGEGQTLTFGKMAWRRHRLLACQGRGKPESGGT